MVLEKPQDYVKQYLGTKPHADLCTESELFIEKNDEL